MAITSNLPLCQWYYSETSEWTLDYPPFFAYFEKILATFAAAVDAKMLTLQAHPYMSESLLLFHRISVILSDIVYLLGSAYLADNSISNIRGNFQIRVKFGLFVALAANAGLILLDNVHFQYNSMLYGIFCFSLGCALSGRYLLGAALFSVLLNFKHIYLYYVPAYVAFYFVHYLLGKRQISTMAVRTVKLAGAIGFPLLLAFLPFLLQGGVALIQQIFQRLFPFKRGLTHAYWAPNFWALYNVMDFSAYKMLKLSKVAERCVHPLICHLEAPKYTSGLVEEYNHSVLPNITPFISLVLVLTALTPIFALYRLREGHKFVIGLLLSSYAFYLFGWHVHEKAVLMICIPMTVLAFQDIRFVECYFILTISALFSLLPLIFTPLENLGKHALVGGYLIIILSTFHYCFTLSPKNVLSCSGTTLLLLLILLEIYKGFFHKIIFKENADFLPLLLTSFLCSIGIHLSYLNFLIAVFGKGTTTQLAKHRCLQREHKINRCQPELISESYIKYVGGIDISVLKEMELGVVSYTVLTYPQLEVVFSADEVVTLKHSYIPEYLAIREREILANMLLKYRHIPVRCLFD
jgi:alpha-1,3-glucosyltransferase